MFARMLTNRLPYRWRRRIDSARHDRAVRAILDTPPIAPRNDGLVLFSMIGTAVLLPYLVAVKSLWHQLQRGRVAILNDGTLTARDRAVLARHCGDPEIFEIDAVDVGAFPTGGTWERLLLPSDRYVNYWGSPWEADTGFLHFVGTHRYDHGAYARESQRIINVWQQENTGLAA